MIVWRPGRQNRAASGSTLPFPLAARFLLGYIPFHHQVNVAIGANGLYIPLMNTALYTPRRASIGEILDDFEFLDDWEDRYRYVIELGRTLPAFDEALRTRENKVEGCVSQVWLSSQVHADGATPKLIFTGDSDAHIVRGLIAILFALYCGKAACEILAIEPVETFERLGLKEHLTPQRSNGLKAMVERIRRDARAALEPIR